MNRTSSQFLVFFSVFPPSIIFLLFIYYIKFSGKKPDVVLLTDVNIAGGKSRAISAIDLKEIWIKAAQNIGIDVFDLGMITPELQDVPNRTRPVFAVCSNTPIKNLISLASKLIQIKEKKKEPGLVCFTGSLHLVSSLLSVL